MGKIFSLRKLFKSKVSDLSCKESEIMPEDKTEKNEPQAEEPDSYNSGNIDRNLVTLLKQQSFEAEQFKILRTRLLFPTADEKVPHAIMVTSAVSHEGKSFVAANLSVSIAQTNDRYVLLMDCDLRSPSIHKIFGFPESPGLSEYLSGDAPLSSLLIKTEIRGVSILPGGKPPINPSELLSSEKMSGLLKEIKARYSDRYIIIDSPPPLLMAGTAVIARQVDGIIIVIKYGKTRQDMISELIDAVEKEKVLGIVLNASTYPGHGKGGKYGKLFSRTIK